MDFLLPNTTRRGTSTVHIGDCLEILAQQVADGTQYDAIITDPPYCINLMGQDWDNTGIAFSPTLWRLFHDLLKPGGYVMAFSSSRLYHRTAIAGEDAGFKVHPMLSWHYESGLPKPVNLSELFDRDNIKDRNIIGEKRGSGFTSANVEYGAQQRSHTVFAIRERHVSTEAKKWRGYYYGLNCFKPSMEPIFLGQKVISEKRMIDNVRRHGCGALNLDALDRSGWPTTTFHHKKARQSDHNSDHPSVKPVSLMEELCMVGCPASGLILDPFAGTGTTGVAATNMGFDVVLIEQNPEMKIVIERRLSQVSF